MISSETREALSALLGSRVAFDVAMSRHTSLRVGGPVDAMATPKDRSELARLLDLCRECEIPQRVLGAGFNTLVLDEGLDGVVIRLTRFRGLEDDGEKLRAEAGVSHASLVRHCEQRGLGGLEFGVGIPGTVGGWVAMNAGIGTREVKDVLAAIELVAPGDDQTHGVPRERLTFRYRALDGLVEGAVIVSATFDVVERDPAAVRSEMDRLRARRSETQPIDQPSCGSVFKNPSGDFAGRLIEECGMKGERNGAAEISTRHANFIVNHGGAKASDVLALIEKARDRVARETGVELETEVRILGRNG